jgi:hypothetical protein
MERSYDSCLSGLFYGKNDVILRHRERVVVGQNFNPVIRRVNTNQSLWVYSVNRPYTFEAKCETAQETREVIGL